MLRWLFLSSITTRKIEIKFSIFFLFWLNDLAKVKIIDIVSLHRFIIGTKLLKTASKIKLVLGLLSWLILWLFRKNLNLFNPLLLLFGRSLFTQFDCSSEFFVFVESLRCSAFSLFFFFGFGSRSALIFSLLIAIRMVHLLIVSLLIVRLKMLVCQLYNINQLRKCKVYLLFSYRCEKA